MLAGGRGHSGKMQLKATNMSIYSTNLQKDLEVVNPEREHL